MSSPAQADRNLLGGVLALQMDFVTGDQLLAAMNAWTLRKETPLLDLLRQDGVLTEGDHDALSRLVERHLARHGGDAQKSLAAVRLDAEIRSMIEETKDLGLRTGHDASAPTVRATGPTSAVGPRFRRLRSHAKGGLGEVFVAEDTELHREIALKEIQERFADYEDSRTRFIREAEITGQLEHPGVVPIYGLGVYGDGRPYYAMRFIRGESMEAAIDRFHEADLAARRDPGERTLALRGLLGRFVAVCNAVGYAHARGIIHRDLKPANVMLGEFGETIVVDWGLARRILEAPERTLPSHQIRLSEDDQRGTQQGQAIGTPAFMPPEQALGELGRVGPASDIFSLGATLYCLLTGKAPYGGKDVLLQAAECKFPAPQQANAAVPVALEAVCLRAMASSPEGRYAKARDLAADVDRWLADEPVSGFREPLGVRAGRWARRNRTLVSSLLVLLLATVTALSVGLVVVDREQKLTADALGRALDAEEEAKDNLERAEENLKLARRAVDECFNVAKEHPRFQQPGMEDVKRLLLEKALPFYKNFRAQRPDDRELDVETADQLFRVAYITSVLGSHEESLSNYLQARDILIKLVADHPDVPPYRINLARTHNNLGNLLAELGRREGAAKEYGSARDIFTKLVADHPDVPHYRNDLAVTHNSLGNLLAGLGRREGAEKEHGSARDILIKLVADHPGVPEYRSGLAVTHNNLGALLATQGRREGAAKEYGSARDIQARLVAGHPGVPQYRYDLAGTHNNLGALLADLGRREGAAREYGSALDIFTRLVADYPGVPQYRYHLAGTHNNLGLLLATQGRREDALKSHQQARDLRSKLVADHPGVPQYRSSLAVTHHNLGALLAAAGNLEEALACFRQVRDLRTRLATGDNAGPPEHLELAGSDYNLACCYALIAAAIRKDDKRPAVLRSEEGEKLAREGMHSLRRAKTNGFFAVPANRKHLDKDTDLDSLRDRADFKAFVATLPKSP